MNIIAVDNETNYSYEYHKSGRPGPIKVAVTDDGL